MPKADIHGNLPSLGAMLQGNVDINPSQVNIPNVDIYGPKVDAGLDISGPKIDAGLGLPGVDIKGPKIGGGIDISGPKIDAGIKAPSFNIPQPNLNIQGPRIDAGVGLGADVQGPKIDANVPLPSLGALLESNITPPQLNLPSVEAKADINLSKPTIDIPAVDVHGTIEKEVIPPSEGFIPKTDIKGIDLGIEPPKVKVDLEKPPIDIPPVHIKEPEVELHDKVVLPPLDAVINANAPDVEVKVPAVIDIPDAAIAANLNLPKKIVEPEVTYEPPKLDFDANITGQPPSLAEILAGPPEAHIVVGSKANKPDVSSLKKKSKKDVKKEAPSLDIKGPEIKVDAGLGGLLDLGAKANLNIDLGKGKVTAEAKVGKKDEKKDAKKGKEKEEPKEKPIQMKNFISQDVNAPIHPVRQIPKIKIFKGFPKKKKK